MLSKLKQTSVEPFPLKIKLDKRDFFALLIIPLIFLFSFVFSNVSDDKYYIALADTLFRGVLFLIVCKLYSKMLKEHWHKFKKAKWASWILVILGAIVLQIVISFTKSLLPATSVAETLSNDEDTKVNVAIILISLGPMFTALLEDIIFRYTLLHKFFIPNNLVRIVVLLLNSALFGLIHYNNFDGNIIGTISYMAAGLFLNLIYIWTNNIWHVLLIHALNNFVLSTLAVIILYVLQAFLA
jgi:membrane protease YdiL (CAAX protease family)